MKNFSNIEILDWRNLNGLSIDFHPRLTIITGPNGSGKSTILSLIASNLIDEFGEGVKYLATPENDKNTGKRIYSADGWFSKARKFLGFSGLHDVPAEDDSHIGKITYGDGQACQIKRPTVS
ncbi:MAG: AAA family ATPase [Planktomarina sp.]